MPDSLMADVANALASRAADVVFDGGVNAWNALVRLVRRRFASEPDAAAVLDAAQAQPFPPHPARALADALEHMAGADGDFDSGSFGRFGVKSQSASPPAMMG